MITHENAKQEAKKRIEWIKEVLAHSGAKGIILGLSGGKDSAVVVALAKKATEICTQAFLTGPMMKQYALPIIEKTKTPVMWFESASQAADYIKPLIKPSDIILIKGSQNTLFLETAVQKLMKNPEKADELLCRRGAFWDKKRSEIT